MDERLGRVEGGVTTLNTRMDGSDQVQRSIVMATAVNGTIKIDGQKVTEKQRRCQMILDYNAAHPNQPIVVSDKSCKIQVDQR